MKAPAKKSPSKSSSTKKSPPPPPPTPKYKWTYTKSPIQVVTDDGMLKQGFIAPELACYSSYGQLLGSVDLPDEYNPKESYACRVFVGSKVFEKSFDCVKQAMDWVELNVNLVPLKKKILPRLQLELPDDFQL